MNWVKYICMCCVFTGAACKSDHVEKPSKNANQKIHEIKKSLTEIDAAFALWYSYQDESFVAARPVVKKDFGPVHNGRDPSEIILLQRELFKILKSQIDVGQPESEAIFKRWLSCQAEATDSLAAAANNVQQGKSRDPASLLDFQDETISLLKNELRRRGQNYWVPGRNEK